MYTPSTYDFERYGLEAAGAFDIVGFLLGELLSSHKVREDLQGR
jgi:hypothetical protein